LIAILVLMAPGASGQFPRLFPRLQPPDSAGERQDGQQPAVEAYNRGVAAWKQGNLDAAVTGLSQAIALQPNFAGAYRERGLAARPSAWPPKTPPPASTAATPTSAWISSTRPSPSTTKRSA
jgi:hypothetical protein